MPVFKNKDVELYYEIHGATGDLVLLIQGVGTAGAGWLPQVKALTKKFRVLTFDNRGYGKSTVHGRQRLSIEQMVEDAKALIEHVGEKAAHIAGHSMGGVIAQRFALTYPKMTKSLVLMCTVSKGADAVRMNGKMFVLGLRTRIGTKAMRRAAFLELIYPMAELAQMDRQKLASELAPLFGRDLAHNPGIIMRQALALKAHDRTPDLGKLAGIKTLVVSATHDLIAPPSYGKKMAEAIPGAKFVEMSAAHGVPIHKADDINKLLVDFFNA